jgi:glucose dehydrogenase
MACYDSRVKSAFFVAIPALTLALSGADITERKLLTAQNDTATWLSYGKNYAGWRYVDLTEINRENVVKLVPRWIYQTGVSGKF